MLHTHEVTGSNPVRPTQRRPSHWDGLFRSPWLGSTFCIRMPYRFYIGHTEQPVEARLAKHLGEHKAWTGKAKDWVIRYREEHPDKASALRREREVKAWKSKVRVARLCEAGLERPVRRTVDGKFTGSSRCIPGPVRPTQRRPSHWDGLFRSPWLGSTLLLQSRVIGQTPV